METRWNVRILGAVIRTAAGIARIGTRTRLGKREITCRGIEELRCSRWKTTVSLGPSRRHQPMLDGKANELGRGVDVERGHDLVLDVFNSSWREIQADRDFLHSPPVDDLPQHVLLARG